MDLKFKVWGLRFQAYKLGFGDYDLGRNIQGSDILSLLALNKQYETIAAVVVVGNHSVNFGDTETQ